MAARLTLVKLNNPAQGNDEPQDPSDAAKEIPNSRTRETSLVTGQQYEFSHSRQWHCCSLCYVLRQVSALPLPRGPRKTSRIRRHEPRTVPTSHKLLFTSHGYWYHSKAAPSEAGTLRRAQLS